MFETADMKNILQQSHASINDVLLEPAIKFPVCWPSPVPQTFLCGRAATPNR
jgi:hypothetical protein